jgi:PleD family two-component response regulator
VLCAHSFQSILSEGFAVLISRHGASHATRSESFNLGWTFTSENTCPLSGHTYQPTLVVDSNTTAAGQLAEQLSHCGFQADIATSPPAAHAAARAKHFGAFVVVIDLSVATDLECLRGLRARAPGTWIIVISSRPHHDAQQVVFHCGADALLIAPFSVEELTFRLSAFSHRSRPL